MREGEYRKTVHERVLHRATDNDSAKNAMHETSARYLYEVSFCLVHTQAEIEQYPFTNSMQITTNDDSLF